MVFRANVQQLDSNVEIEIMKAEAVLHFGARKYEPNRSS